MLAGIVPGFLDCFEAGKYPLGVEGDRSETAVLRQRLRFTNKPLGIGLRGLCGSNRLVDVTARALHDRKQLYAEFIECVALHFWQYHGSDRVLAPYRCAENALAVKVRGQAFPLKN